MICRNQPKISYEPPNINKLNKQNGITANEFNNVFKELDKKLNG